MYSWHGSGRYFGVDIIYAAGAAELWSAFARREPRGLLPLSLRYRDTHTRKPHLDGMDAATQGNFRLCLNDGDAFREFNVGLLSSSFGDLANTLFKCLCLTYLGW